MNKKLAFILSCLLITLLMVGCSGGSNTPPANNTEGSEDDKPIELILSASLAKVHYNVEQYMDPFADALEAEMNGKIKFNRFYAGELAAPGRELDALEGIIDVASPFLAPYHEGLFPLTDVTQLPILDTTSVMITKAFQKLMDSDVALKDGQTFTQLELEKRDLVAWPVGSSAGYVINTVDTEFETPDDFKGVPLRSGTAVMTLALKNLGFTPVLMPAAEAYESIMKNTINGSLLCVADWNSYRLEDLFRYSLTGINLGHFSMYMVTKQDTWDKLPADVQEAWDRIARETAIKNAEFIDNKGEVTMKDATEKFGTKFVNVDDLDPSVKQYINEAATKTWQQWIENVEAKGAPGKACAKLWAELIVAEGGRLPEGVEALLNN